MNMKLHDFIDRLSSTELRLLEKTIQEGALQKMVQNRLSEMDSVICPVCSNTPGPEGLILIFGTPDFRKKATFCGYDCLQYFINKLKAHEVRQQKIQREQSEKTSPQQNK